jgi:ferrochelatase
VPEKLGVLLANVGSAAAPKVPEVRAYLRQFLSDPRIIDIAAWKRAIIVNCFILPFRPKYTAEAYEAVWTERGSPLIAISEDFRDALAARLPALEIAIGMAYGEPSISRAFDTLLDKQVDRIVVVPMFPQYASATTGSVLENVYRRAAQRWNVPALTVLPPFYDDPAFLDAWRDVAKPTLEEFQPEHVVLSYHGLPERQIRKSDPTGKHCLCKPDCCDQQVLANRFCYRRQCIETSRALAGRLGLTLEQHTVAFQSRLGRDPWLTPATDQVIRDLAKKGVKRLAVLSPAFVADCLETLEEIGMRAKEDFIEHGGEEFVLVPSLNAHPAWVETLAARLERLLVQEH